MEETSRLPTLHDRMQMLRRYRLVILGITAVAAAVALGLSMRSDKVYEASAQVSFHDVNRDLNLVGGLAPQSDLPATLAAAAASTLTRQRIIDEVRRRLGTNQTNEQLRDAITATVDPTSNLVVVTAEADSGEFAARLANTVAARAVEQTNQDSRRRFAVAARQLRARLAKFKPSEQLTSGAALLQELTHNETLAKVAAPADLRSTARVPTSPSSPKPIRNTILGGILGLIVALVIAFILSSLDRRLRNSGEIQSQLQMPVIGHVRDDMLGKTVLDKDRKLDLASLEAFRMLRTNLDFMDVDTKLRSVAITSALPEEGKSTVAASLAIAATSMGARTLLVECDLRHPALAGRLHLAKEPGLTDYLTGTAAPGDILQSIAVADATAMAPSGNGVAPDAAEHQLVCITAGTRNPRAGELLGSERFKTFLEQVADAYDLVILDTAPVLPVADTLSLAPLVDRVLVCVRAARTTRAQAQAGIDALKRVKVESIGIVATGETKREEYVYGRYTPYAYAPS